MAFSAEIPPTLLDQFPLHNNPKERARARDLLRIVPKNRVSVLDIGARDGFFSALLRRHFESVTALDLTLPPLELEGVRRVQGDVTDLRFPDNSFDVVFCTEVLEHVPQLEKACREIARVTRHEAVIGVPFRQDLRAARTTCAACGRANPPWGHINRFDERRLRRLFAPLVMQSASYVGTGHTSTTPLSAFLMDLGRNPWGAYSQQEPCMYCGARLVPPVKRSLLQETAAFSARALNALTSRVTPRHASWMHAVLRKNPQT
jgi:SAM-dependent methyltransferase